jgi:hypothetical protein
MSAIVLGIIFFVLFCVLALLLMGAYLLSKLLGGFSNLKNLFSQLTGWGKENREKESAKTSSSRDNFSRTANKTKKEDGNQGPETKVFGQNEGTYIDFEEVK